MISEKITPFLQIFGNFSSRFLIFSSTNLYLYSKFCHNLFCVVISKGLHMLFACHLFSNVSLVFSKYS